MLSIHLVVQNGSWMKPRNHEADCLVLLTLQITHKKKKIDMYPLRAVCNCTLALRDDQIIVSAQCKHHLEIRGEREPALYTFPLFPQSAQLAEFGHPWLRRRLKAEDECLYVPHITQPQGACIRKCAPYTVASWHWNFCKSVFILCWTLSVSLGAPYSLHSRFHSRSPKGTIEVAFWLGRSDFCPIPDYFAASLCKNRIIVQQNHEGASHSSHFTFSKMKITLTSFSVGWCGMSRDPRIPVKFSPLLLISTIA